MQSVAKSICFFILCAATLLAILGGRLTTPARRTDRAAAPPAAALTTKPDSSPAESPAVAPVDQVTLALKSAPLDHCAIEVEIVPGWVILQGHVVTDDQKALAEVTAARVPGVLHVENRLLVQSPKAIKRSSMELAEEVKNAIKSKRLTSYEIDISVGGSIVYLTGQVLTAEHRELVGEAALSVPGIKRVDNRLTIAGGDAPNQSRYLSSNLDISDHFALSKMRPQFQGRNQQLAELVHQAIATAFGEIRDEDSSTRITVLHGRVRLEGFVRNAQMKADAEVAASSVPGVVHVENLLSVAEINSPDPRDR